MKDNKYNYNNQSGMFRNRIKLLKTTQTIDDLHQDIESVEDFGFYWAMIKTNRARHLLEDGQDQTQYLKRYVIKYTKRLNDFLNSDHTNFKVLDKGIEYEVLEAVNDNDLNTMVTIYVRGYA